MRPIGIVGILLITLGVVVLIGGGTFSRQRDRPHMGDVKITTYGQQSLPPWASGLAIVAGVMLVVSGTRRRTA
jgi:drug/metabolite transporter (DMT)-like permease